MLLFMLQAELDQLWQFLVRATLRAVEKPQYPVIDLLSILEI